MQATKRRFAIALTVGVIILAGILSTLLDSAVYMLSALIDGTCTLITWAAVIFLIRLLLTKDDA
jgi:hypothetical protein